MKALQREKSVFHRSLNMHMATMNTNYDDFLCTQQNEMHIKMREQCMTKCKTSRSSCIFKVVCELCDIRDGIGEKQLTSKVSHSVPLMQAIGFKIPQPHIFTKLLGV